MYMLGWHESCSSLAKWEQGVKCSDIGVYTINTYVLTNESKSIFLYLHRLCAPSGNVLMGTLRVLPQQGTWHRYGRYSSSWQPCWPFVEREAFLHIKTQQGNPETPPCLPCSGQQVTLEESPWRPGKQDTFLDMRAEISWFWWVV